MSQQIQSTYMTQSERHGWIQSGQFLLLCTLGLLLAGAVSAWAGQVSDQVLQQVAATATASADIHALADRIGKVESQINYVLMATVGSILAQLFQLRATKR